VILVIVVFGLLRVIVLATLVIVITIGLLGMVLVVLMIVVAMIVVAPVVIVVVLGLLCVIVVAFLVLIISLRLLAAVIRLVRLTVVLRLSITLIVRLAILAGETDYRDLCRFNKAGNAAQNRHGFAPRWGLATVAGSCLVRIITPSSLLSLILVAGCSDEK
jgi:hypothetical protein